MKLLLSNLLTNAVRHTTTGGQVTVALTENVLSVCNSGETALNSGALRGFAPDQGESHGAGLGLAICQKIAALYGWELRYRLEMNGHVFSVLFPEKPENKTGLNGE